MASSAITTLRTISVASGTCAVTLTRPPSTVSESGTGVVIVPPLGIEHNGSDRLIRALAEHLSADGHTVMAIDPVGTGDSSDLPDDVSISTAFEQATIAAIATLRAQQQRVVAIGIRFGALTIATALADDPLLGSRLDAAILWAPIARGKNYRRELIMLGASTSAGMAEGWAAPAGTVLRPVDLDSIGALDLRRVPAPSRRLLLLEDDTHKVAGEVVDAWRSMAHVDVETNTALAGAVIEDPERGQVCETTLESIVSWTRNEVGGSAWMGAQSATERSTGTPFALAHQNEWTEDTVGLTMPDGEILHGIRTVPVRPTRAGLVLLSTGTNPRFGPARLHASLARSLAGQGFAVLRVERRGGGTAAGEVDAYDRRHVADVRAIDAAASKVLGTPTIVLAGMCSGAWAAWHATLEGVKARRVVLMNQIIFGEDSWDLSEGSPAIAVKTRQSLGDMERWRAIAHGEINVIRSTRRLMQYGAMQVRNRFGRTTDGLAEDLRTLIKQGTPVSFIFDSDETGLHYLEMHGSDSLVTLKETKQVTIKTVEGAGHVFAPPSKAVWLSDRLGVELEAAAAAS